MFLPRVIVTYFMCSDLPTSLYLAPTLVNIFSCVLLDCLVRVLEIIIYCFLDPKSATLNFAIWISDARAKRWAHRPAISWTESSTIRYAIRGYLSHSYIRRFAVINFSFDSMQIFIIIDSSYFYDVNLLVVAQFSPQH